MNGSLEKVVLKIDGMDCAEEISAIKSELSDTVGGESNLVFDLLNSKLTVLATKNGPSTEIIIEKIKRLGMTATIWNEQRPQNIEPRSTQKNMQFILTSIGFVFLALGFGFHIFSHGGLGHSMTEDNTHDLPTASIALFLLSSILCGMFVFPKAWSAARRLRPDMNLLMTIAVFGAMGINEWLEAATVSFLFSVSLLLESWSVERARKATKALLDLAPDVASVVGSDGVEKTSPTSEVQIGTTFIVRPGERFPLDGEIIKGSTEVNQAPITGESLPVAKSLGDVVYAGTINGNGAVFVKSTKSAQQTTLAHIIQLVGEAHSKRSDQEQWVEKFARVYTPAVMGIAVIILFVPPIFLGGQWSDWIYKSLSLLVIACPCALVISTPVSIVAALASAARNGVLIKGGKYVELPARISAIAFDKTGTLTKGKLKVSEVFPMNHHSQAELLSIAASLESHSEHPIAQAILQEAEQKGISFKTIENYQTIQGKGATGLIDNEPYWLGSHRYLEELKQETSAIHEKLEALTKSGHTVVVVGNSSHVCGFISLSDEVRAETRDVISSLKQMKLSELVMLTGDNRGTAEKVAQETGVTRVYSELLPSDKVSKIEKLTQDFGIVAMVGDGINDAPAMARASLSIAMGAAGSDAAIESADIALMSDDLTRIPWLISHSRRSIQIIKTNIAFSLVVKGIFMVLTFAGYSSLWGAIAADMGASLLVIFNGLRLLK